MLCVSDLLTHSTGGVPAGKPPLFRKNRLKRSQKLLNTALAIYPNAAAGQQFGGRAVPGNQNAGKAPVVDFSKAAGGTSLLHQGRRTVKELCQLPGLRRSAQVLRGDILAGAGIVPAAAPLGRLPRRGQPAQLFRTGGNQMEFFLQRVQSVVRQPLIKRFMLDTPFLTTISHMEGGSQGGYSSSSALKPS